MCNLNGFRTAIYKTYFNGRYSPQLIGLRDVWVIFEVYFWNPLYRKLAMALAVKLLSYECYRTSIMDNEIINISFGNGLVPSGNRPLPGPMWTQICRPMTSLCQNGLTKQLSHTIIQKFYTRYRRSSDASCYFAIEGCTTKSPKSELAHGMIDKTDKQHSNMTAYIWKNNTVYWFWIFDLYMPRQKHSIL